MAKPIKPTPDFEGEDADKLVEYMLRPQSKKDKQLVEEMKKQRHVSWF